MRRSLLYRPDLLFERIAQILTERRRLRGLRNTVAANLKTGHIDSLELLELLRSSNPQVIYDIGANVGTWTLLAKALYPTAQVHAFEPLPAHIDKFKQLTKRLPGVSLHEIALGPHATRKMMKVTDFSDASSLLALAETGKKHWHLQQVAEIPVKVERLDDWISSRSLPNPDLIKLDVQGFELEVLRGAPQAMRVASSVLTEVSFTELYSGQCLYHEVAALLAQSAFHAYAFGHSTPVGKPLLQIDCLFVKAGALPVLA
jgi:FkbM family methyltransferase